MATLNRFSPFIASSLALLAGLCGLALALLPITDPATRKLLLLSGSACATLASQIALRGQSAVLAASQLPKPDDKKES